MANDERDEHNVSLPTRKCDKATSQNRLLQPGRLSKLGASAIFWPPTDLQLVHSVNPGKSRMSTGMTIDDVSARRAISAISSQPVNAPPTRRSRNGSRASTVSCPRARGFCTAKNSLVSLQPGTAPKENPCRQKKIAAIKQAFRTVRNSLID